MDVKLTSKGTLLVLTTDGCIQEINFSGKVLRKWSTLRRNPTNIKGSISLQGAIIDDITFKNYNEKLESDEKVMLLNPKNSSKGYYIETGWASDGDSNIN